MDVKHQYNDIGHKYIEGRKEFDHEGHWYNTVISKNAGSLTGCKVLDIGCGGGSDVLLFEKEGAQVFGIDPSEFMINEARKIVSEPNNLHVDDYENIPFPDKTFDVVFGRFSLHYLKTFDKAYAEMQRVLVPHGRLILIVGHPSADTFLTFKPNYKTGDLITIELFNNQTKLSFPPHHFGDYFSRTFFKLFNLEKVEEYSEEELKNVDTRIPSALLYCARSKDITTP